MMMAWKELVDFFKVDGSYTSAVRSYLEKTYHIVSHKNIPVEFRINSRIVHLEVRQSVELRRDMQSLAVLKVNDVSDGDMTHFKTLHTVELDDWRLEKYELPARIKHFKYVRWTSSIANLHTLQELVTLEKVMIEKDYIVPPKMRVLTLSNNKGIDFSNNSAMEELSFTFYEDCSYTDMSGNNCFNFEHLPLKRLEMASDHTEMELVLPHSIESVSAQAQINNASELLNLKKVEGLIIDGDEDFFVPTQWEELEIKEIRGSGTVIFSRECKLNVLATHSYDFDGVETLQKLERYDDNCDVEEYEYVFKEMPPCVQHFSCQFLSASALASHKKIRTCTVSELIGTGEIVLPDTLEKIRVFKGLSSGQTINKRKDQILFYWCRSSTDDKELGAFLLGTCGIIGVHLWRTITNSKPL